MYRNHMYNNLRSYFEARFPLTEDQFDFIKNQFIHKRLNKGEFLIREGEQARYGTFVAKGCLRQYIIDSRGKEHILQFLPETWWISNPESILNGTPSTYFVDAIEESDLLLIDNTGNQKIMEHIPGFAEAFMKGIQKHAAAKDKRIASSLSASAEEKYMEFLETYPSIALRVPQHMLASYLGIAPETLSRIRKRQTRKK
jgi:CRP-like cAMP-binding protein